MHGECALTIITFLKFLGFVVGICFFQVEYNQDGIQNVYGAFFFMLTTATFSNMASVQFTFPEERPVFLREHHNGMYRTDVYFLSKTFAETPQFFVAPLLFLVISYWMVGLRPDALRFFYAYGTLALVSMAAVSFAYVISTLAPSSSAAIALSGPLTLPLLLLGGFFVENTTIPEWLTWLQYLSWFNYGFEALVVNQWDNYGNITCSSYENETHTPCIYNGNGAIEARGLNKDDVLIDVYGLLALTVGFRIISYLFLLRSTYKRP